MIGMLQILTYLLAFYLALKGYEILVMSLASSRSGGARGVLIAMGVAALIVCVLAAFVFVDMQDRHVATLSDIGGGQ